MRDSHTNPILVICNLFTRADQPTRCDRTKTELQRRVVEWGQLYDLSQGIAPFPVYEVKRSIRSYAKEDVSAFDPSESSIFTFSHLADTLIQSNLQ